MEDVILTARRNGCAVYWTGRAGDGWVSEDRREAYRCTASYGEYRANSFNKYTSLHGMHFQPEEFA